IGCLFVQLLRQAGAAVVGCDPIAERAAIARRLGATAAGPAEVAAAAQRELSQGRGADQVIITGGGTDVLPWAVGSLHDGGTVHGPGGRRAEELPVPEPETGELVLRIEAALTCGTDVKTLRRGHPVMIPKVPTVFGHEFAGTVAAVGAGVPGFREGDRVVAA